MPYCSSQTGSPFNISSLCCRQSGLANWGCPVSSVIRYTVEFTNQVEMCAQGPPGCAMAQHSHIFSKFFNSENKLGKILDHLNRCMYPKITAGFERMTTDGTHTHSFVCYKEAMNLSHKEYKQPWLTTKIDLCTSLWDAQAKCSI